MSYTPPTYVDTKSQAILALASVIADEDKTALGDGSVNRALDVLADVLADSDVQVPQTNAGAILALAQYAGGMVKPEGAIAITENGTGIDVAQYATADVSVSGGGGGSYSIECYDNTNTKISSFVYAASIVETIDPETEFTIYSLSVDTSAAIDEASAGQLIAAVPDDLPSPDDYVMFLNVKVEDVNDPTYFEYPTATNGDYAVSIMPSANLYAYNTVFM